VDDALRRFLQSRHDVRLAYLYGSRARGQAGPDSDWDIGVLFDPPPEDPLATEQLALDLARALGIPSDRVDLRDLQHADARFLFFVLRDGRCVHARDEADRIDFETRALSKYYDFLPHMEEQDRAQRERFRRASA